ncbi:MAG: hypothetical protein L0H59_02015 [Tomitella sp.]|nr:hypothetical protein [Tomitella sp.]
MAVPIWQYPQAAEQLATALRQEGDEMDYAQALTIIASTPVQIVEPGRAPLVVVPADMAAATGSSLDGFIAEAARLHADGVLTWDADRRMHVVQNAAAELFGLIPA